MRFSLVCFLAAAGYLSWVYFTAVGAQPWVPYATSKADGRLEYWFTLFQSRHDCLEITTHYVNTAPQNVWYREPVGCTFKSNSYLITWLTARYFNSNDVYCILKDTSVEAAKQRATYIPALRGYSNTSGNSDAYCM